MAIPVIRTGPNAFSGGRGDISVRNFHITLAALALATAIPAQAVTLYGTADLGVRPNLRLLGDFIPASGGRNPVAENIFGTFLIEGNGQGGGSLKIDNNGGIFNTGNQSNNPYLEIKNGTYTREFAPGTVRAFSFLFEGLDDGTSNNISSLTVNLSAGDPVVFGDLQDVLGGGLGRAYVDTGGSRSIISLVFRGFARDGGNAAQYNIDGFATAAPEPATWGMLILGFGMAGLGLRNRNRARAAA